MHGGGWDQNAKAIFLPFPGSLDLLSRSTVRSLLAGASGSRFLVTHEDDYLPGVLDSILCNPGQFENLISTLGENIIGSHEGTYRCAALWDWDRRSGLLIHKKKKLVLCAFLPLVSEAQARLEKQLTMELSQLALRAGDTIIDLGHKPITGKQKLSDVSRCLAAQIDPDSLSFVAYPGNLCSCPLKNSPERKT